jgi:hypothetical protein
MNFPRKILTVFAVSVLGLGLLQTNAKANSPALSLQVDDRPFVASVDVPDPYVNHDGYTMVPLQFISKNLGASVTLNDQNQLVMIQRGDTTINIAVGLNRIVINGSNVEMNTTAVNTKGGVFVPVRYIAEALGHEVKWDGDQNKVYIITDGTTPKTQTDMRIPETIDVSHAAKQVATTLTGFFNAKSSKSVDGTMSFFAESPVYYDAILGWAFPNRDALKSVLEQYMPTWGDGLSYPTRIIGDKHSAIVFFTDTPELFGEEIHTIGSVTFNDQGKVTRWADYWDARSWNPDHLKSVQTPEDKFPNLSYDVPQNASKKIIDVSNKMNTALANNDYKVASELFAYESVYEDMTLHTQIQGQAAIEQFFQRASQELPYGSGSTVRYVV